MGKYLSKLRLLIVCIGKLVVLLLIMFCVIKIVRTVRCPRNQGNPTVSTISSVQSPNSYLKATIVKVSDCVNNHNHYYALCVSEKEATINWHNLNKRCYMKLSGAQANTVVWKDDHTVLVFRKLEDTILYFKHNALFRDPLYPLNNRVNPVVDNSWIYKVMILIRTAQEEKERDSNAKLLFKKLRGENEE